MSHLFESKLTGRKIFQISIFQDGIWDIQIGGMILLFSFYPLTRKLLGPIWNLFLIFGLLAAILIVGATLKRYISNPRKGLVEYGKRQKAKLLTMQILIFSIFLISTVLAISLITNIYQGPNWGANVPRWFQELDMDIVFGLVILAIFSLVSAVFKIWRPLIYGFLLAGSLVGSAALFVSQDTGFQYPFAISGGAIMVIGISMFIHFVRRYQIPVDEV